MITKAIKDWCHIPMFLRFPFIMKNLSALLFCVVLGSCGNNANKKYTDTPTSGTVNITADEAFMPLTNAQKDAFMGLYHYAKINVTHKPESECFRDLINDSSKVILATRKLNEEELKYFKGRNLIPVTTKVAIDAVALIVHEQNNDTLIRKSDFKKILNGEISNWKTLNENSLLTDLTVVFDHSGSGTARYLRDSLLDGEQFPSYCYALKNSEEVIKYVKENKNAIGIIGVAWISDRDEPMTEKFLEGINVVSVSLTDNPESTDDYFKPYQAYIALGQYPFLREVYLINREGRTGLGTGFVSFVAGDPGQRIIRLTGLLPATMPVRIIKQE